VNSLILRTTERVLAPLLILFSIFVLLRGHQEPGGGFAGGLLAAAAFSLKPLRNEVPDARKSLRVEPHFLIGLGLLMALSSGLVSMFAGQPFLTGISAGALSTVLFFDIGVYLTVMGVVLMIIFNLAEE
jgi:multicomponent Na+:H+ antiporter subunit B